MLRFFLLDYPQVFKSAKDQACFHGSHDRRSLVIDPEFQD